MILPANASLKMELLSHDYVQISGMAALADWPDGIIQEKTDIRLARADTSGYL